MDQAPVDIAFVMTGDLFRNIRALKQVRTLAEAGYTIEVIALRGNAPAAELGAGVRVRKLTRPPGRGPLWFYRVHRLFLRELAGLRARCYHASDLYALTACEASRRAAHRALRRSGPRPDRRSNTVGKPLADPASGSTRGSDGYASSPPILTYDARELYTSVSSLAHRPLKRWFWTFVERRSVRRANRVFTVSNQIAEALSSRYNIERPSVVMNVPDTVNQRPGPGLRTLLPPDVRAGTAPIVLHLGQMRKDRGCDILVRAVAAIEEVHLVFLGYGPERRALEELAEAEDVGARTHFVPPVPPDQVHAAIRDASVGVTLLQNTCLNHRFALPNKLFDYIHAELPVLAAHLPAVADIVQGSNTGITVEPDNTTAVAHALDKLIRDQKARNRYKRACREAQETFSWASASDGLLRDFESLLSP